MLKITGMDHLNINVKSIKESTKFYKNLFGFQIFEEGKGSNGQPYAIIGKTNIAYLCIYQDSDFEFSKHDLSHIGFNVENFDQVVDALKESKVPMDLEYDYKYSRSIYITDPSGYEIELSEKFGGDIQRDLVG